MQSKMLENGNLEVTIRYVIRGISGRKRILAPDVPMDSNEPIVVHLARAHRWQKYIDEGRFANTIELSRAMGVSPNYAAQIIRLALLSPSIAHKILMGEIPKYLTLSRLRFAIPDSWKEQERLFLHD